MGQIKGKVFCASLFSPYGPGQSEHKRVSFSLRTGMQEGQEGRKDRKGKKAAFSQSRAWLLGRLPWVFSWSPQASVLWPLKRVRSQSQEAASEQPGFPSFLGLL